MDSTQADQLVHSVLGRTVGGWLVEKAYGFGKSAIVLAATKDGVPGAVKVFHPELVEHYGKAVQLERIRREKALIGAEHPNLVRILDGGECALTGHLFVVMAPLPYPNLREVLAELPEQSIPKLIEQIASAARFLEDRNLVHRDIKPENIAISPDFGQAILLDLGVLKPIGQANLTDVNQRPFIGTLRYSSPEFLRREELDTVDGWRALTFYQLGAVLHDMLMKRQLFDDESEPYAVLVEAVKSAIPRVVANDARLATLANHCLVKNPLTRTEIVSWSDFSDSPAEGSNATVIRERIKQRQKYFQTAAAEAAVIVADEHRLVRLALDDLCNRLESRIAALMNDLQCFPLRTTKSEKDISGRCFVTCVYFDSDIELGLPNRLTVMLEISLVDLNGGAPVFKASSAAALSIGEPANQQLRPTHHFASGESKEILDSQALEAQFTEALEKAYQIQEQGKMPSDDEILRLIVGGS